MRTPRVSIADTMLLVAIVSLDCLAIRGWAPLTAEYLIYGGSPTQCILLIVLLISMSRRSRGEKSLPFLTGFEVVGWSSHILSVALCRQAPISIDRHLKTTFVPMLRTLELPPGSVLDKLARYGLGIAYLTSLQLIPALIVGWIWRRLSALEQPEAKPRLDPHFISRE
ncbi:MAG: hypothetical protein U0790_14760 [Isosphaeraceae bacterium]